MTTSVCSVFRDLDGRSMNCLSSRIPRYDAADGTSLARRERVWNRRMCLLLSLGCPELHPGCVQRRTLEKSRPPAFAKMHSRVAAETLSISLARVPGAAPDWPACWPTCPGQPVIVRVVLHKGRWSGASRLKRARVCAVGGKHEDR